MSPHFGFFVILITCISFVVCQSQWHLCQDISEICDKPYTYVPFLENLSLHKISKTPMELQWKTGQNLSCSDSFSFTDSMDSLAILMNGSVVHFPTHSILDFEEYCLRKSCSKGFPKVETVDVCFQKPTIPVCLDDCSGNCSLDVPLTIGRHHIREVLQGVPTEIVCEDGFPVNISLSSAELMLYENSLTLLHHHSALEPTNYIKNPDFCLSSSGMEVQVSYCFPSQMELHLEKCQEGPCVRKCCPPGYLYDLDLFRCVPAEQSEKWYPTYYSNSDPAALYQGTVETTMVYGLPLCRDFFPISPGFSPPETIKLLANGSLLIEDDHISMEPHRYCIDNFQEGTSSDPMEGAFSCFSEQVAEVSECPKFQQLVYPILLLISSGFILVTLLVYGALPELHCKLQNKCLLSSLSALFVAYLCLSTMQIASDKLTMPMCITTGLVTQYTVLASFFWLNVMSFDIWKTLRSMSPRMGTSHSSRHRFMLYSLYGWGCPLLISIATVIMQFVPNKQSGLIKPGFGETSCLFTMKDESVRWIYMYGFICVILLINTGFFIHLAIILRKAQELSENTLGKQNQQKKWAKLYFKLFLIMGISWILEAASWVEGTCVIWIATDINNSLRGFFIFVVLVCKKDILDKIRHKSRVSLSQVTSSLNSSFLNRSSTKRSNKVDITSSTATRGEQTSFVPNSTDQPTV